MPTQSVFMYLGCSRFTEIPAAFSRLWRELKVPPRELYCKYLLFGENKALEVFNDLWEELKEPYYSSKEVHNGSACQNFR